MIGLSFDDRDVRGFTRWTVQHLWMVALGTSIRATPKEELSMLWNPYFSTWEERAMNTYTWFTK